jgi:hypothetical protein
VRPADSRHAEQRTPTPGLSPHARPVCHHPSHACTLRRRPGSESRSVKGFRVPLCKRLHLSTPGVLGSGASSVVSHPHRVLRPHPPVPQARSTFTASPVICRAFAVRERLGDPRDLPYFHCRAFQACRRPYAGGSKVLVPLLVRTLVPGLLALSPSRHPQEPASASNIRRGVLYDAASFASCCGPSVCQDLRTGSHPMASRVRHPAFCGLLSFPLGTRPVTDPRWESG